MACCRERPKNGKYAPLVRVLETLKIRHSTWRERREVLAVSGIWYHRELNLQISCVFVMIDIKMISNVAQATFCKVILLYTNYAISYILCSINQQNTISSIYPYRSISYYPQYLVFNYSFKPQYIVLPGIAVPIKVLRTHTHAQARTRTRVNTFPCVS